MELQSVARPSSHFLFTPEWYIGWEISSVLLAELDHLNIIKLCILSSVQSTELLSSDDAMMQEFLWTFDYKLN